MKKVLLIITIVATTLLHNSFAQANKQQYQLSQLLTHYYNLKNALVADDIASASTNAQAFLETANTIDYKIISEGNIHTLSSGAGKIARANNLKEQRENFALLSTNMVAVVKAIKLADRPIYQLFCPMKKAYWLSSEKEIMNPYFGSTMLTCGEVTGTLQ